MKKWIAVFSVLTACIFLLCGCAPNLKESTKALDSGDAARAKAAVQRITAIYKDYNNKERYSALNLLAAKAGDNTDVRSALDTILKELQAKMDPNKPIHDGEKVDDNASTIAQIGMIAEHLPKVYEEKLLKMMQESKTGTKKDDLGKIAVFYYSEKTGLSLAYFTFYPMPESHRLSISDFDKADTAVIYESRDTVVGHYDDNITVATATVFDLEFYDLATGMLVATETTNSAGAPAQAIAGSGCTYAGMSTDEDIMNCILRNTK